MEIVNQEEFLNTLENLKKEQPDVYANRNSNNYIDIEKAKNIIKLVIRNEKLNKFLISGFLERYVEYIYKNRELINNLPESQDNRVNQFVDEFHIRMSTESFKKILGRIVIDDIHLDEESIEESCKTYEKFINNTDLYYHISKKFLEDYATFVYFNRYQIRKLLSKDLNKVKMDSDGNYILDDDDFIEKVNCDGGHNSPLWICINIDGDSQEEKKKFSKQKLDMRLRRLADFPESLADIRTERQEEKITRKQAEEEVSEDVKIVETHNIKNDIVVKNLLPDNERETALIAEEIARQLRLPVAQYYPARYIGTRYTKEEAEKRVKLGEEEAEKDLIFMPENIVLTPNFLEKGEELITGDRIAKYEMDISVVPKLIREYLKKDGVPDSKIEELISDYRTVMAFNCFINHRDCHNGNWGFIKKADGDYKISHIFDLEGCLDENTKQIRAIYIGDVFSGTGENIDESLLQELFKDKRCREKMQQIFYLDMDKVFMNIFISKGITIPKKKQVDVIRVISREKQIFAETMRKLALQESEKERGQAIENVEEQDIFRS